MSEAEECSTSPGMQSCDVSILARDGHDSMHELQSPLIRKLHSVHFDGRVDVTEAAVVNLRPHHECQHLLLQFHLQLCHHPMLDRRLSSFVSGTKIALTDVLVVDLGGLGVTCSPRDPRFAGSNPAEVDGFFRT